MNLLITAGGTTEPIDSVRGITNFSTGQLGAKLADEFALKPKVKKIFYVCAKQSVQPVFSDKINVFYFTDVASIEQITCSLLQKKQIDVIIHSAAISDYVVSEISGPDGVKLNPKRKISSNFPNLTIKLKPAPKVISKFKTISPHSVLIGFKLLSGVSLEELFIAADKTLNDNGCLFVLANRLEDISAENHRAYLRDKNGAIAQYSTKTEIAKGLAENLGF